MQSIIEPLKLYSRQEIVSRDSDVIIPNEPGVCAFYFKEIPGITPTNGCIERKGKTLLFISETAYLRARIKAQHLKGRVGASTLRVSLAALLHKKSGYSLQKRGAKYLLNDEGEEWLNLWMDKNAFVCWQKHDDPNTLRKDILKQNSVPLNIRNNDNNNFKRDLGFLRGLAVKIK